eukprot:sb/3478008/
MRKKRSWRQRGRMRKKRSQMETYFDVLTDTSKQPIKTRYLGHVTGYQPIRGLYFLTLATPDGPHAQIYQQLFEQNVILTIAKLDITPLALQQLCRYTPIIPSNC